MTAKHENFDGWKCLDLPNGYCFCAEEIKDNTCPKHGDLSEPPKSYFERWN